ncbi:MAG: NUDIX domain-containing protein [Hydrogenophilus sp.]|nr:NUDIX domain-containing protein [Hydrogenophilus sp.]
MTDSFWESHLAPLAERRPNGEGGLPEPLFLFISRYTPLVNVDLLIRDEAGNLLLTWRADRFYGPGWHLPGGIVRYKERLIDRLHAVAHLELGATIEPLSPPIGPFELFARHRDERGHFLSFLWPVRLLTPPCAPAAERGNPTPGAWAWHPQVPENLLPEQECYRPFLTSLHRS